MPTKPAKLTAEQQELLNKRRAEAAAGAPAGPSNAEKRAAAKTRKAEAAAREAAAEAAKAQAAKNALEAQAEEVRKTLARARINGDEKRANAAKAEAALEAAKAAQKEMAEKENRIRKKAIKLSERPGGMGAVNVNRLRAKASGNFKERKTRRNRK
jgi:colicin import membrane protein